MSQQIDVHGLTVGVPVTAIGWTQKEVIRSCLEDNVKARW